MTGKCVGSCSYMEVFTTIYTISGFCSFMLAMPTITATLRCIPEKQKSFALGIQWIVVRTLGAIPGPIVLGSLMDQACLLWQSEDQGSCFLYENSQMSYYTLINCIIYKVLGGIFFILALVFYKDSPEPPISPECTESGAGDTSNLNCKTEAIVNQQTRL